MKSAVNSQKEEKEKEKKNADGDETLSDINMSEDEDQEFNLQEEFRQCGLQMQELLLDG